MDGVGLGRAEPLGVVGRQVHVQAFRLLHKSCRINQRASIVELAIKAAHVLLGRRVGIGQRGADGRTPGRRLAHDRLQRLHDVVEYALRALLGGLRFADAHVHARLQIRAETAGIPFWRHARHAVAHGSVISRAPGRSRAGAHRVGVVGQRGDAGILRPIGDVGSVARHRVFNRRRGAQRLNQVVG